mmetsp:Transcript_40595/g.90256  ORF Transcript_40595/g.90256 Transcript_40595/m.90256 type:complete len:213 (-) Transcript_40595:542-1180(-)
MVATAVMLFTMALLNPLRAIRPATACTCPSAQAAAAPAAATAAGLGGGAARAAPPTCGREAAACDMYLSTSSLVMRPPGPEPDTLDSSTPASLAIRRTAGEVSTAPESAEVAVVAEAVAETGAEAVAEAVVAAVGAAAAAAGMLGPAAVTGGGLAGPEGGVSGGVVGVDCLGFGCSALPEPWASAVSWISTSVAPTLTMAPFAWCSLEMSPV